MNLTRRGFMQGLAALAAAAAAPAAAAKVADKKLTLPAGISVESKVGNKWRRRVTYHVDMDLWEVNYRVGNVAAFGKEYEYGTRLRDEPTPETLESVDACAMLAFKRIGAL